MFRFCYQAKLHHSCIKSKSYLLVVIIIILWDKNIMLLKQRSKVLANQRPDIEKGDHNGEHTEKAEGHLQRVKVVAVSVRAHSSRTTEGLALSGAFPPVDLRSMQLDFKVLGKVQSKKKNHKKR